MNIPAKITCSLVLVSTFLLILTTGRSNVKNFNNIQTSIENIYEDRLVVKGIIFDISSLLYNKQIAVLSKDMKFYEEQNTIINEKIMNLLVSFRATYLTTDEETNLEEFSEAFNELQVFEKKEIKSQLDIFTANNLLLNKFKEQMSLLHEKLKVLSSIQISEGKLKLKRSEEAVESMRMFESIENIALIIISILLIIVIFFPKNKLA